MRFKGLRDGFKGQTNSATLKAEFAAIAEALTANEEKIVGELIAVQVKAVEIGGYYQPDEAKAAAAMRPSVTFYGVLG